VQETRRSAISRHFHFHFHGLALGGGILYHWFKRTVAGNAIMSQTGPASIVQVATQAWRDAFRIFRVMGPLVAVTAALSVLFAFVWGEALQAVDLKNLSKLQSIGLPILSEAASNFILTPLVIAVYRFILLGESTATYRPVGRDRRSTRFFLYLMLLSLALGLFRVVAMLVSDPEKFSAFGVIAFLAVFVAYAIFDARTTILFPALAIDVAGADVKTAFHDSRRHFWRITLVKLCTLAPLLISTEVLGLWWKIRAGAPQNAPFLLVMAALSPIFATAVAAAASQLYRDYADELTPPPALIPDRP
jgi:hypothetical protein